MTVTIREVGKLSCDPHKHRRVWLTEKDGIEGQAVVCPECEVYCRIELENR